MDVVEIVYEFMLMMSIDFRLSLIGWREIRPVAP